LGDPEEANGKFALEDAIVVPPPGSSLDVALPAA
jgi:hypothetical protein